MTAAAGVGSGDIAPDPTRLTHRQAINRMQDIGVELERLDAMAERGALTPQDERAWADMVNEAEILDAHVRELERQADRVRVKDILEGRANGRVEYSNPAVHSGNSGGYDSDPILNFDSIEDHRFRDPWDLREVRTFGRDRGDVSTELRSRALCAIERMPGADDKVREGATQIIERWDDADSRIAKMCLATSSPAYMRAWSKLARGKGHMFTPEEQQAMTRAMSLTDSAGGYLVPFQLDPTVIITSTGTRNDIRKIARQVVATGDVWNGVSAGQVTWAFAAEATEASDNAPTFSQPTVPIHKAQGFVPISIEALDDEANVTQEVARLLAFGREDLEANKFIVGTGTGEPFGIVAALTGTASEITTITNDVFALADVYKLDNNLPARYRTNASWLGHRAIYNLVRAFDTAGGAGMWVQLPSDQPAQMLGRDVYEAEAMDNVTTDAKRVLIYGDFSNYVIADRVGMTVEFIPHLLGANRRPQGQRGWYAYYRVGADSVNDGGFRMLKVQ
jgi:HK97 family phage major capsid protein